MNAPKPQICLCCGILPEAVKLDLRLKKKLKQQLRKGKTSLTIGKDTLELFTLPCTRGCGLGRRIAEYESLASGLLAQQWISSTPTPEKAEILEALNKTGLKKAKKHVQFFLLA